MYLATLYVQQVLGYSVARASLLFPAFNIAVIGGFACRSKVLRQLGARWAILTGFAAVATGTLLFATLPEAGAPIGRLLTGFAVMGAGLGVASVASTHAGTEAAEPADRGVVSGVLNSAAQSGPPSPCHPTPSPQQRNRTMTGYRHRVRRRLHPRPSRPRSARLLRQVTELAHRWNAASSALIMTLVSRADDRGRLTQSGQRPRARRVPDERLPVFVMRVRMEAERPVGRRS